MKSNSDYVVPTRYLEDPALECCRGECFDLEDNTLAFGGGLSLTRFD